MPVSSEICAFQFSTGVSRRNSSSQWPSPSSTSSCSGSGSDTPPRAASRASRSSPTSLSSPISSLAATGVEVGLDRLVGQLGARPHQRPLDLDVGALAGVVDLDRPQQRRVAPRRAAATPRPRSAPSGAAGSWSRRRRASRRGGWPRRRRGRRASRRRPRRRSRSGRRSPSPSRSMCIAWSRSRRRLGVDGDELDVGAVELGQPRVRGRRRPPPARRRRGRPAMTFSSCWIAAMPSRISCADTLSPLERTFTTRLLGMSTTLAGRDGTIAPYACPRADPAAAQRGQDRSPPRQAPRPRRPWPRPSLTATRTTLLEALAALCRDDPDKAAAVLGLGPGQRDLVQRNAGLETAPTARADAIYTGVLYDALGLATLSPAARRRATVAPRGDQLAVRARPPGRPDPGLPPLRRRRPPGRRLGRRRLARGPRRGDHRRHAAAGCSSTSAPSTYAAFWRPDARPGPPRRDRPRAPRVGRPAHRGEPLQQGHQGPDRPRPPRGRRRPPHPEGPRRHARPPRLDRRGRRRRTPKGTQLDVVVSEI